MQYYKNDFVTWIDVDSVDKKRKGFLLFVNKKELP